MKKPNFEDAAKVIIRQLEYSQNKEKDLIRHLDLAFAMGHHQGKYYESKNKNNELKEEI